MSVKYLENWAVLNEALKTLNEHQCSVLLVNEKAGKQRLQFMLRIYGRYNILRMKRERLELMKLAK